MTDRRIDRAKAQRCKGRKGLKVGFIKLGVLGGLASNHHFLHFLSGLCVPSCLSARYCRLGRGESCGDDLARAASIDRRSYRGAARESARNEYAFSHYQGGGLCTAVLNRTFVDEEGTRCMVDYKAGERRGDRDYSWNRKRRATAASWKAAPR